LYRVTVKTTHSRQPGAFWECKVLYCGLDRDEARIAYHESAVLDDPGSPGNWARKTQMEVLSDAGTSDFADDELQECAD
jgi:hypothetical protein